MLDWLSQFFGKKKEKVLKALSDKELLEALKKAGYESASIVDSGLAGKEIIVSERIPEGPEGGFPLFWRIIEQAGRSRGGGGNSYHQITN